MITSGRSGSSFLLDLLHSIPELRTCGEYFTDNRLKKENLSGRDLLAEFIDVMKRERSEKVVGAKFLYHQLEASYADRFALPELLRVQDYILSNKKFKVIHLTRRNKLRTAVSLRLAHKSGVYHATEPDSRKKSTSTKIEINPKDLIRQFEKMESDEINIRLNFSSHSLHEVVYEDLLEDQEREVRKICKFLGVKYLPTNSRRLVLRMKNLSDSVMNYDELEQALNGTRWGEFLSEVQ